MVRTFGLAGLSLLGFSHLYGMDPAYRPLWLYKGAWKATVGTKTDLVVNDCARVGRFFACQQTVNGKAGAVIMFVPASAPGDYYTQAVLPEGWAAGRGELRIDGDHWTYSSKTEQDGKTVYHRTTNVFSGKNRIHFEQADSTDRQNWTVTSSGDEVRTSNRKP